MKRILFIALLGWMGFAIVSCKKSDEPKKIIKLSASQEKMVESANEFGFDLLKKIDAQSAAQENYMISPLSVSYALFMAYNGAAGETRSQMKAMLHATGLSDEEFNKNNRYIMEALLGVDNKVQMRIANSIWYHQSYQVLSSFIQTNKEYYKAVVRSLDFSNPESVVIINNWVSEITNGKIPSIIDGIPADAVLYLINAVYFNGKWKYQFDESQTLEASFYLEDGQVVQAETMSLQASLRVFEHQSFRALELPYGQGNFSMIILLPNPSSNVSELTGLLNAQNWNSWMKDFTEKEEVVVKMPKFGFSYEAGLKEFLHSLGMTNAFTPYVADFSGINPAKDIFISRVIHKTFVEVDESGTEAAAVTAIEFETTSVGPSQPVPYYFIVDKPFLFVIRERDTNALLFTGKVMNPVQ